MEFEVGQLVIIDDEGHFYHGAVAKVIDVKIGIDFIKRYCVRFEVERQNDLQFSTNSIWLKSKNLISTKIKKESEKLGKEKYLGMKENKGKYEKLATEIGKLVDEKNRMYGDAINDTGEYLKLLFPDGIPVERYGDLGLLVRMFDKQKRIANGHSEDSWEDLIGYGLLGKGK